MGMDFKQSAICNQKRITRPQKPNHMPTSSPVQTPASLETYQTGGSNKRSEREECSGSDRMHGFATNLAIPYLFPLRLEDAIQAYNRSLLEHRHADTLKRLNDTEKLMKVCEGSTGLFGGIGSGGTTFSGSQGCLT